MPAKAEEKIVRDWLAKKRILFEIEKNDFNSTIAIKFIDYKNECLLAERVYPRSVLSEIGSNKFQAISVLVKKFEQEEIYPMLFGDCDVKWDSELTTLVRLIRED